MSLVAKSTASAPFHRGNTITHLSGLFISLCGNVLPEIAGVAFPLICYSIDHRWYTERTLHLSRLKKGMRIMTFATLLLGATLDPSGLLMWRNVLASGRDGMSL